MSKLEGTYCCIKGKQCPGSKADRGGNEAACLGTGLSAQQGPTAAQGSVPGALLVGAGGGFPGWIGQERSRVGPGNLWPP